MAVSIDMDGLRHAYLDAMGVDVWVRRELHRAVAEPAAHAVASADAGQGAARPEWQALETAVAGCRQCALHEGRTQTVFGVGNRQAEWLVIGEAPGAEEDKRGEPFVGRAGELLNGMLAALGYTRDEVFIANILKCRPPRNRDPLPREVTCCEPYLTRQIELIGPKIILAVGRIAAQNLLKVDTPIGRMRGRRYSYGETGIPVVVTYHPAYLLRSPHDKRKAWEDLVLAQRIYGELT